MARIGFELTGERGRGAVVFTLLVALLGCKGLQDLGKKGEDTEAAASASAAAAGPSAEEEQDYALAERISAHIDCINFATRDAYRARRGYLMRIDEKQGPTGKEKGVWLPKIDPQRCVKGLAEAKAKPPALPEIDAASERYLASLQKLTPLVKEASNYYEQKDFEDDAWAKGKQMHAGLMAAFTEFDQANDAFEAAVLKINEGLSARRLQRLKADPEAQLAYRNAVVVADAKALVQLADVADLESLDLDAFSKALEKYDASYQESEKYDDAHPDEAAKVTSLSQFRNRASDLLKSGKALARAKRDGKKLSPTTTPELDLGQPANVLKAYNELIEASNGLDYR